MDVAYCVKSSYAGNNGFPLVFFDAAGNDMQQPYTRIKPLYLDSAGDTAECPSLLLSASEYQSLLSRVSALENRPAGSCGVGGSDMSVSADIFVGAALVLCLAVGWIAGGQR